MFSNKKRSSFSFTVTHHRPSNRLRIEANPPYRSLFRPRMGGVVGIAQAFFGDVGVDLRGGEGCVAEEGLDAAEVGTVVEEVGSEGVTQFVGGDVEGDAGESEVLLQEGVDRSRGETLL